MKRSRAAGLALAALLTAARCEAPLAPHAAPTSAHGTVVIEPPELALGDSAVVEVAVVTPPGWSVPAIPAPQEIPGLSVFEVERPLLEKSAARWIHRTRFHVRVRSTGSFRWPALPLTLADAARQPALLELPARPFEVRALLADADAPRSWLSYRAPAPRARRGTPPWLAALAGAASSLVAVAAVAALRRRRRAGAALHAGGGAARVQLPELFAEAEAFSERDSAHAADLASLALRSWLDGRYRTSLLRSTTQELAAAAAPIALAYRWSALIPLLEALDALRFRPGTAPERELALRALLVRARALVHAMAPAEPAP